MITVGTTSSGKASILDNDGQNFTVVLDNFVGEFRIDSEVVYLHIILHGDCDVQSDIELSKNNKLDSIKIDGSGFGKFTSLKATSISLDANMQISRLYGNSINISGGSVTGLNNIHNRYENCIEALGHVWFSDCKLDISDYTYGIKSPYVLFENCTCNISSSSKAIQSPHNISVEYCKVLNDIATLFKCTAEVRDNKGNPKSFIYKLQKNSAGQLSKIYSRETLYAYDLDSIPREFVPGTKASPYDYFKDSTNYTNPNLHRRIDQNGEILKGIELNVITNDTINKICSEKWDELASDAEAISNDVINEICADTYVYDGHAHYWPVMSYESIISILDGTYVPPKNNGYEWDELLSRNYEVGIYDRYSYRSTDYKFHDEESIDSEIP